MVTADELKLIPLFAPLPDHERETIAGKAAEIAVRAGDWLVLEGEMPSFFALLSGKVRVFKLFGDEEREINEYGQGAFFGEVPLLLGSAAVASVRAIENSRVLRLEASDFRQLIGACQKMQKQIVESMTNRITGIQSVVLEAMSVKPVRMIGGHWDLDCHDLRDFLARNHVTFEWIDPESPSAGPDAQLAAAESYPLLILTDGTRLSDPTYRDLATHLGLRTAPDPDTVYDVAIVGAGPAGLAAGVYGASEGLKTLIVEREAPGGQAGTSSRIENYLGFPAGLSGDDLSTRAWRQAKRFGAQMLVARDVTGLELDGSGPHHVVLDGGERVTARALVIATGVSWRKLEAEGIDRLAGRGVYYGAARTEALGTRGKEIFLVGGGNSAGQAAMFFSQYAKSVTILIRAEALSKSMSQYLIEQLESRENVHVVTNTRVVGVEGDAHIDAVVTEDVGSGERQRRPAHGLFIFIGADAETATLPKAIVRDEKGYVCTGRDVLDIPGALVDWPLERDPYLLETSVPGVFAAGDVRHGSIKRVASGVGEGSMSIAFIHRHLEEQAARK